MPVHIVFFSLKFELVALEWGYRKIQENYTPVKDNDFTVFLNTFSRRRRILLKLRKNGVQELCTRYPSCKRQSNILHVLYQIKMDLKQTNLQGPVGRGGICNNCIKLSMREIVSLEFEAIRSLVNRLYALDESLGV